VGLLYFAGRCSSGGGGIAELPGPYNVLKVLKKNPGLKLMLPFLQDLKGSPAWGRKEFRPTAPIAGKTRRLIKILTRYDIGQLNRVHLITDSRTGNYTAEFFPGLR
jgi:hypothetical protein